ncbi:hypothetical protein PIB30_051069 [Stylosanthes scabra]|uniref:Uncharacterized protein n=1 Tax=Stylosanthes scabra TaxID=79078 RepID=A0ABU6WIU9_9FABA|nr:hypothetical protein [Stylosanthes scabra]
MDPGGDDDRERNKIVVGGVENVLLLKEDDIQEGVKTCSDYLIQFVNYVTICISSFDLGTAGSLSLAWKRGVEVEIVRCKQSDNNGGRKNNPKVEDSGSRKEDGLVPNDDVSGVEIAIKEKFGCVEDIDEGNRENGGGFTRGDDVDGGNEILEKNEVGTVILDASNAVVIRAIAELGPTVGSDLARNGSSSLCPFPQGFGPCADGAHIHKDLGDVNGSDRVAQNVINTSNPNDIGGIENPFNSKTEPASASETEIEFVRDTLEEADTTKRVCEEGGIRFCQKNEEALMLKLAGVDGATTKNDEVLLKKKSRNGNRCA